MKLVTSGRARRILSRVTTLPAILLFMLLATAAGCASAPPDDAALEARVLAIVKAHPEIMAPEQRVLDIIRDHGEVVFASVEALQKKQDEAQHLAVRERVRAVPLERLVGDSPARGAAERRFVLVEFSDFQCPYCERAFLNLKTFMARHGDEVTLVYKHLPLTSLHPEAANAALAAWAAGQQGKFWEYHDQLFQNQDKLGEAFYKVAALAVGLDLARFETDRASAAAKAAVQADFDLAQQLGLTGTPSFVFDGEPFTGAIPVEQLEARLARAKAGETGTGVAAN